MADKRDKFPRLGLSLAPICFNCCGKSSMRAGAVNGFAEFGKKPSFVAVGDEAGRPPCLGRLEIEFIE